jgi:hypothetical protein
MARFVPPIVVSAILILWAPFIGEIRNWIKAAFPGQFVELVGGAVVGALGAALLVGVVRIRTHRLRRYGALAAAAALFVVYILAFRTGNREVDAVELFHFVEYELVTFLFYRAVRPAGDFVCADPHPALRRVVGTLEEWFWWFLLTRGRCATSS